MTDFKKSEIFLCTPDSIDNQIIFFWSLKAAGIHLRMIPSETQLPQRSAATKMIEEIQTIRFKLLPTFRPHFWIKRLFDLVAAILLIVNSLATAFCDTRSYLELPDCGKFKDVLVMIPSRYFIGTWFISCNGRWFSIQGS